MENRTELDMVAAHKRGIVFFEAHGEKEISAVLRHARRLYDTEHERDAFAAGYIGALRRSDSSSIAARSIQAAIDLSLVKSTNNEDEDMFSDEHRYKGKPRK